MGRNTKLVLAILALGCGCKSSVDNRSPLDADATTSCAGRVTFCEGDTFVRCAGDEVTERTDCSKACDDVRGCVDVTCADGNCEDTCSAQSLARSYIGCEYFPTITGNFIREEYNFAVVVSNGTSQAAEVTVVGGALDAPETFTIAPKSLKVQRLPWELALKSRQVEPVSAQVSDGSYHLRSTQPVTVYQYNPLEYSLVPECSEVPLSEDACSMSNDASLLFPAHAMGREYVVASYPQWVGFPSIVTITATIDGTDVTVTTTAPSRPGEGMTAFEPGVPRTVRLDASDVLQLTTASGDFTGTRVVANQPIQVLGGHFCTNVPLDTPTCDHLEESMFPIEALGTRYLVTTPAIPSLPDGRIQITRIIATESGTVVSYDPALEAPTTLTTAGEFIEIQGTQSFEVRANHRILVSQYMLGLEAGGDTGDPSMTLAVPVEQYRSRYAFHAPTNYTSSYVNVTAPMSASISLDSQIIEPLTPIGATGFGVARLRLDDGEGGEGDHFIEGDAPFGISVYGYGRFTSYWYPGGLQLEPLIID